MPDACSIRVENGRLPWSAPLPERRRDRQRVGGEAGKCLADAEPEILIGRHVNRASDTTEPTSE